MKINERPYQIVGMHYVDYVTFCKCTKHRIHDTNSKKEFFKLALDKKLIKTSDNKLLLNGEELVYAKGNHKNLHKKEN